MRCSKGVKYIFFDYAEDDIIRTLCVVLAQINGYIKYFDNGGKIISFVIKGYSLLKKYNEISHKMKWKLGIKFHSKQTCL